MKENEELYDYSKYIRVPQDNEDINNLRESIDFITDEMNKFVEDHSKDESPEIKDKVAEYDKISNMILGVQLLIEDFDPERIEDLTNQRLDDELQDLKNFKEFAEGGKGISNFRKFLDYVKTLENGEQLADNFIKGFKALNDNQKLGMNIDKLMADNYMLSAEEVRNIEREKEEEKKKKAEQDAIGHVMHENKLEEYEEQAKNDGYVVVNHDDDNMDDIPGEPEEEIEDLNERLAKGSVDFLAEAENPDRIMDNKVAGDYNSLPEWDKVAVMGFGLDGLYENMLEDLLAFKEAFSDAQIIKGANFKKGVAPEGPEDYQEFAKSLNDCIKAFAGRNNNGMTMVELGRKYNDVLQRGQKYRHEHKPRFRSHRSEETAKIYDIMGNFVDKGTVYVNAFNGLSESMNDKIKKLNNVAKKRGIKGKEIDLKTIKCSDLQDYLMKNIAENEDNVELDEEYYKKISNVRNATKDKEIRKLYEDKVYKNLKKNTTSFKTLRIDDYRDRLQAKAISNDNNLLLLDNGVHTAYDLAEAYLVKKYIDKANRKSLSIKEMDNMVKETNLKAFNKSISELSLNPVFKECLRMSPSYSLVHWSDVEARVSSAKKTHNALLNKFKRGEVSQPDKEISASVVASIVVMMGHGNPKFDEAFQNAEMMRSFNIDGEVVKKHSQDGISAIADALNQPNGFMSKIQGKTFSDVAEVIKMIEDEKPVFTTIIRGFRYVVFPSQLNAEYNILIVDDYAFQTFLVSF